MERQSTKHGPVRDEELKRETEVLEHGAPRRPHIEEWREVEPAEFIARFASMPAGHPFGSVHEVMVARGINVPERRPAGGSGV